MKKDDTVKLLKADTIRTLKVNGKPGIVGSNELVFSDFVSSLIFRLVMELSLLFHDFSTETFLRFS